MLTGPSGSGKSSLAFDTLYAEGKRQYIESLSIYARQFLDQMSRPDVDVIDGLQPTLCIDQRPGSQNPRSTVATITEIYDYLRLMMARLGTPTCYQCGAPIEQQSVQEIVDRIAEMPAGTKLMVLAPLVRGRKGTHKDVFQRIRKAGLCPRAGRWRCHRSGQRAAAGGSKDAPDRRGGRSDPDEAQHRNASGSIGAIRGRPR